MTDQALDNATTTILRRYSVKPGEWDAFLEVWHRISKVRQRHGFKILFAFVDKEENMFTWAISYKGDIDAAGKRYYEDPERVELKVVENYLADHKVSTVQPLVIS
ncbi:hypothetical protein [Paraburkholderia sp. GAS334]|uniref:hypothetical protein n=1 Tax=Paraburkholderia sp. GAS334 TaxID=3035131 RepID=UPI003D21416F